MEKTTRDVMKKVALGSATALSLCLLGTGCNSSNAQVKILDPREVVPTPYYDPAPASDPVLATSTSNGFGSTSMAAPRPAPSPSTTVPPAAQDPVFARPVVPDNNPQPDAQQTRSTQSTHTIDGSGQRATVAVSYDVVPEVRSVEPLPILQPAEPLVPADREEFTAAPRSDVALIADTPSTGLAALPPIASSTPGARRSDVDPLTYQVQKGDSLWKIGKMYGVSSSELAMANNMDKDDTLTVGRVLTIPAGGRLPEGGSSPSPVALTATTHTPSATPSTTVREAIPASGTYTVQKGDSLWKIGMKYNMKVSTLEGLNPQLSGALQPGDTVYLTSAAAGNAPPAARTTTRTDVSAIPAPAPAARPTGTAGDMVAPRDDRAIPDSQRVRTERLTAVFPASGTGGASNTPASHTVASGDSLWKIAKKYGVSVAELKAINNLTDDRLDIGDVIRLRRDGGGAPAATPTTQVAATPPATGGADTAIRGGGTGTAAGGGTATPAEPGRLIQLPHFVEQGDSLAEIADMYNSNVEWILDANPQLKNGAKLEDQKQIMVPVPDDNGF